MVNAERAQRKDREERDIEIRRTDRGHATAVMGITASSAHRGCLREEGKSIEAGHQQDMERASHGTDEHSREV